MQKSYLVKEGVELNQAWTLGSVRVVRTGRLGTVSFITKKLEPRLKSLDSPYSYLYHFCTLLELWWNGESRHFLWSATTKRVFIKQRWPHISIFWFNLISVVNLLQMVKFGLTRTFLVNFLITCNMAASLGLLRWTFTSCGFLDHLEDGHFLWSNGHSLQQSMCLIWLRPRQCRLLFCHTFGLEKMQLSNLRAFISTP